MQKVPILPTTPWQGGDPKHSTAVVTVVVSTFKPSVLIHSQAERASRQNARVHQVRIVRAGAVVRPGAKAVVRNQTRSRIRRLGHQVAIVTRPAAQLGVRRDKTVKAVYLHQAPNTARRTRLRRHDVQILRAPLFSRPRLAVFTHSPFKPQRRRRERHKAFIFRAPIFIAAFVTAETIKHVYVRSVGRAEQLTRHRRHDPQILKAGLLVTTATGRISLHPVDRSKSQKLRKARLAYIFRSRGGVATVTTAKTLLAIYLHPVTASVKAKATHRRHRALVTRSTQIGVRREKTLKAVFLHSTTPSSRLAARFRRHKAKVSRAPIVVKRGTVITHSVKRRQPEKTRKHRVVFWRSRETVFHSRTTKPVVTRVLRKRHIAWHRRHFARILRSLGGQSVTQVSFVEPFDQPTPTGRTGSRPTHTDYDIPGPLGRVTSFPQDGSGETTTDRAFDIPVPIGIVDIPDPEV